MSAFLLVDDGDGGSSNINDNSSISDASDDESFYDEDIDAFGTISTGQDDLEVPPDDILEGMTSLAAPDAFTSPPLSPNSSSDDDEILPPLPPIINTADRTSSDDVPKPPPGKSIAHWDIEAQRAALMSFDLETAGELGEIIHFSAEIFRPNPVDPLGTDFIRVEETFDSYVCPPDGAIWNEHACRESHGLGPASECIKNARPFAFVWHQFEEWFARHISPNEICIFVAWNGATCDLRWLWRQLQAPRTELLMPSAIKYFLDPMKLIRHYKSCAINPIKSKIESLELGDVWSFLFKRNLNGAHNSLVDVKAQTDIVTHPSFVPFLNRKESIRLVSDIFSSTKRVKMAKKLEPTHPVHQPWEELDKGSTFQWKPDRRDTYKGGDGAGKTVGPSAEMKGVARTGDLAKMFFQAMPLEAIDHIVLRTNAYAHEDWVVEAPRLDREGNVTKRSILKQVFPTAKEKFPPGARHHHISGNKRPLFASIGFVIAWFGILILCGAFFRGDSNRGINAVYATGAYGLSIPVIQNAMPKDSFTWLRNYIHFSDGSLQQPKGHPDYDPLFKV